jgi:preprotein translocase subunit YajC
MFLQTLAMAAPAGADGASGSPSSGFTIGWMVFMVAIFYFVMIRPQRRREKERKALIAAVKTGDRVLLTSGILGEVCNVKDKTLLIRIAEKTKIETLKSAVSQVLDEKADVPADVQA